MSEESTRRAEIEAQAADWLVRVNAPDVCDEDIIALTAWLEASPAHVDAYDQAERLWVQIEETAASTPHSCPSPDVIDLNARRTARGERRTFRGTGWRPWAALGGIAASVIFIFVLLLAGGVMETHSPPAHYRTAKGETREITLADGTRLHLNSNTSLTVTMQRKARLVDLDHGEVSLTVARDADRPLTLRAGDARITDIGTQFNVLRHKGTVTVTVREGKVGIGPIGAAEPVHILTAGEQSVHVEDGGGYSREEVDPSVAFAWEEGRVVYHDRPLSYVVNDLNRYFEKPLFVDDEIGQLRLTAIITLDSEALVVKRLEAFLPVEAKTTDDGIRLQRRD